MSRVTTILFWTVFLAIVCGGLGFAIGFFGPLIFMPEANQGPLMGIFVTGPAGVLIGAIAGAITGIRKLPGK